MSTVKTNSNPVEMKSKPDFNSGENYLTAWPIFYVVIRIFD